MSTFEWKITDTASLQTLKTAANGSRYNSPMFMMGGFRWRLEIYPNGGSTENKGFTNIYLKLMSMPPNVKQINVGFQIVVLEINKSVNLEASFTEGDSSWGWGAKRAQTAEIQNCQTITFTAKVEINGVYNNNDDDITSKYVKIVNFSEESKASETQTNASISTSSTEAKLESLTKTVATLRREINDLKTKINEEQKNDDDIIHKLVEDMKEVKTTLSKLSVNNNMNPKHQRLKAWLEDEVELPQYYDIFIENGIDDISIAALLTMETIKGMSIDKVGHQMKILNSVIKLNQNKNDNQIVAREGGTEYH